MEMKISRNLNEKKKEYETQNFDEITLACSILFLIWLYKLEMKIFFNLSD